ncbi:MAG: hypothetical protein GY707_07080 [Desulfobacteraceae bacterium]|nr:hypothetical protein [Desulfobacteraceae bacterium]
METDQERRRLFAAAEKFSAVVATLGIGGSAVLAPKAEAGKNNPLQELLHSAVKTGDMNKAFKQYGTKLNLNKSQVKALRSLTNSELGALKQIQKKLAPLGDQLNSLKIVF